MRVWTSMFAWTTSGISALPFEVQAAGDDVTRALQDFLEHPKDVAADDSQAEHDAAQGEGDEEREQGDAGRRRARLPEQELHDQGDRVREAREDDDAAGAHQEALRQIGVVDQRADGERE